MSRVHRPKASRWSEHGCEYPSPFVDKVTLYSVPCISYRLHHLGRARTFMTARNQRKVAGRRAVGRTATGKWIVYTSSQGIL